MKSQKYHSILELLPIKNPTPKEMALVCPHLTEEEAVKAFTTSPGRVACPSLRVRHAFQIVSYTVSTKDYPAELDRSYPERTPKSYSDGNLHRDIFAEKYTYVDKAMNFADNNWGDELVLDDWISVAKFYIQDPTDLGNYYWAGGLSLDNFYTNDPKDSSNNRFYPSTKAIFRVALNRDFNEIANDHSKPQSELFDEAVSQMALSHIIGSELIGNSRSEGSSFNCAYCGSALSFSFCSGCGHRFQDDQSRSVWHTPLSRKMVEFLRKNGHKFKVDPEIAWAREKTSWENSHLKKV